jgi:hypothetical protein
MKLSSVVHYKNHLNDVTPAESAVIAHDKLAPVLHSVKSEDVQFDHLTETLEQNYKSVLEEIDNFDQTVDLVKQELDKLIKQIEPAYYAESLRLFTQEMIYDTAQYVLTRRFSLTAESENHIRARIQRYGNWHYSGMIIHPGREEWITHLVGCDPLYLVAPSYELLEPAVLRFNDQYQRRLRTYTITESLDTLMLEYLPNSQIGFCLVYNFFNYRPREIINQYLAEIYQKLKPGGTVAFTFNDCDQSAGVKLAERNFMCYTPGREIASIVEKLGYEIVYTFRADSANTWMEIKKSGTLSSIRGGQSLAKVLYKDEYYNYTKEQIESIKQQALDLNIATPEELINIPLDQIVKLIKRRIPGSDYTKDQIETIKKCASGLNIATTEELNNMSIGHIVELIKQRNSK